MGVDLGLAAADQYYKADDARVLRDQQRQFADAELSLLPDKTEAIRTGLRAKTAQNMSDLETAPNKAIIAKTLSNTAVDMLPQTVTKMKTDSLMSTVDASHTLSAGLGKLIYDDAPDDVVTKYVNDSLVAQGKQGNVTKVGVVNNPNDPSDNTFVAYDETGNPVIQLSGKKLLDLKNSLTPGKSMIVPAGGTAITVNPDGSVRNQFTSQVPKGIVAPTAFERNLSLLQKDFGMTKQQALDHLNEGKKKKVSWDAFISPIAQKRINDGGKLTTEEMNLYRELYDNQIVGGNSGASAPTSNSQPASTLNDSIYRLTGVKKPASK